MVDNAAIEQTNEALRELGIKRAGGQLDASGYRRECGRILRELELDPLAESLATHPGRPAVDAQLPENAGNRAKNWLLWLFPVLIAVVFLVLLALIL